MYADRSLQQQIVIFFLENAPPPALPPARWPSAPVRRRTSQLHAQAGDVPGLLATEANHLLGARAGHTVRHHAVVRRRSVPLPLLLVGSPPARTERARRPRLHHPISTPDGRRGFTTREAKRCPGSTRAPDAIVGAGETTASPPGGVPSWTTSLYERPESRRRKTLPPPYPTTGVSATPKFQRGRP
jgi:hypothetical protein